MKFIVPTIRRVGSTLVCEALRLLLDEEVSFVSFNHQQGHKISAEHLQLISDAPGIVKTHSIYTPDLLRIPSGFHLVTVARDFPQVLCSHLLYQKNVRTVEQLQLDPPIANVLSVLGNTTDAGFLNIFIESNPTWVRDEARKWRRACVTVLNPKVTQLRFEQICSDYEYLWSRLTHVIKPKVDKSDFLSRVDFMQMKDSYTHGFLRAGGSEDYTRLLDDSSKSVLEKVLAQVNKENVL
jgi:hypothetical protein